MDNGSLKHEACTRQLHSSKSETLCSILQTMTFSLTFTASQWCLFWRLLNVGCMMADELLDLLANSDDHAASATAQLWNQLSTELASLLKKDEVRVTREKAPQTTA